MALSPVVQGDTAVIINLQYNVNVQFILYMQDTIGVICDSQVNKHE